MTFCSNGERHGSKAGESSRHSKADPATVEMNSKCAFAVRFFVRTRYCGTAEPASSDLKLAELKRRKLQLKDAINRLKHDGPGATVH